MHIRGIFVHIQRTAILVKAVLKVCILMRHLHIYTYKKKGLYLCSDILSVHYFYESYLIILYINGTYVSQMLYQQAQPIEDRNASIS